MYDVNYNNSGSTTDGEGISPMDRIVPGYRWDGGLIYAFGEGGPPRENPIEW